MNELLYKNNQKIIGSIIKLNRINQNISQKDLSKGICVPSYLSRIENGELLPSDDVLSIIFNKLSLKFNNSEKFIKSGQASLNSFFENLKFNEFDFTTTLFSELEKIENEFLTSPLILDYYLAKLARYCSTPSRKKFESSKNFLLSAFELLSEKQKYQYNFYLGVDYLNLSSDMKLGKEYMKLALNYKENGHCYYWLSYAYRVENNPIKGYDSIKKALDLYVADGNFISIMNSYEKIAEVYFLLDNYNDAIIHLKKALRMATTIKNLHYIEHINSIIAWSYFRLLDFNKSLYYLSLNTAIANHRLLIPDALLEILIYFTKKDYKNLKSSIPKIQNPQTLEQMDLALVNTFCELFNFSLENSNYIKNPKWEELLLYIIHNVSKFVELKKVFLNLLKNYYVQNRRYKDAILLLEK